MNLILNEPSGVDAFPDGSAQLVANRITEQLRNPTKMFRTDETALNNPVLLMGLNGAWGSGKSNVLGLVRRNFEGAEDRSKFIFFEYDCWRYRLDLSRKMFLEELVDNLCDEHSPTSSMLDKKIRNEVKFLTGRTIERRHELFLAWPIVSCLFCFVGFLFLKTITSLFSLLKCLQVFAEWLKDATSYLMVLFLLSLVASAVWSKMQGGGVKDVIMQLWGVLKGRFINGTTMDFEHEAEPSIKDFVKFLNKIAKAFASHHKNLVVVLDNMDRLLPAELMKCLAAIHILFADRREQRPSNLRVIVPYDAVKVGGVFAEEMKVDVGEADDYFRRTFDVVYRISPQLGSNWEVFFDRYYDIVAAGDEVAMSARDEIREIINYLIPLERRTPRSLIAVLNEIAEIKNTFGTLPDVVKMKDIAVFACAWPKCKAIVDRAEESASDAQDKASRCGKAPCPPLSAEELILNGRFIANVRYRENVYLQGTASKLATAAIYYQTKQPQEVLCARLVSACLKSGSAKVMAELVGMRGFASAYERVLGDLEISDMENSVYALCGLPHDGDCQPRWNRFYKLHRESLMLLHNPQSGELREHERLVLVNITPYNEYAARLRQRAGYIPDKNRIDYGEMRKIADAIESALNANGKTQIAKKLRPVSADNYLEMLREFRGDWKLASEDCDVAKFDEYCAKRSSATNALAVLQPLRYLEHDKAVKMRLTRAQFEKLNVDNRLPDINAYLCVLENLTDGVVATRFDRSACDACVRGMNDPSNRLVYELGKEEVVFRVVAMALRYGGFPFSQGDVEEVLSDAGDDTNGGKVRQFISIACHYFTPENLLKRLKEQDRKEAVMVAAQKRLADEIAIA